MSLLAVLRNFLASEMKHPLMRAFGFDRSPWWAQVLACIINRAPWLILLTGLMWVVAQ